MNNASIKCIETFFDLPDNVHKHIAQFLKGKDKTCIINLMQNAGCPKGYHSFEEINSCQNCSNIYKRSEVYILLKKGGDKTLFEEYVNAVKYKLTNKDLILKGDYSRWNIIGPPWKMGGLVSQIPDSLEQKFKGPVSLQPWETETYKIKYVFSGLYFALFYALREELHPIPNFYISVKPSHKSCVGSSSMYYEIIGKKNIKHPLSAVNKLYNKYTFPRKDSRVYVDENMLMTR